jgi:16S rRNA (guanine966-N2)-methyltransferase
LRITGGVYKGRKIICPPGEIRPAMDRMRESMFAILADIEGCSWLDLFAGSGIVGIEAASRGAEPVVFVEKDIRKKHTLKRNTVFVTTSFKIVIVPALRYLRQAREAFDYIYLDPPFALAGKTSLLERIDANLLLRPAGTAIIHAPREEELPERIGNLGLTDRRRYGRSVLSFYRHQESLRNPAKDCPSCY